MAKKKTKTKRRTYRKKKRLKLPKLFKHGKLPRWIPLFLAMVVASFLIMKGREYFVEQQILDASGPEITEDLLTINDYSRPGKRLRRVRGIVIHYVANPGSSAKENRDYFESLKDSHITKASSHYVIGLNGEIIQCIPTNEIAYASNRRNSDTIAIECCHPSSDGHFNEGTYASLVNLTTWLCKKNRLSAKDVIRHYDVTGKLCPLYYVENEEKWEEFRQEIEQKLKNY